MVQIQHRQPREDQGQRSRASSRLLLDLARTHEATEPE